MSEPAPTRAGGGDPVVAMLAMSSHRAPCSRAVKITLKLVLCRKQSPERLPWKLDLAAQGCPAVSDTRIHWRSNGRLARGSAVLYRRSDLQLVPTKTRSKRSEWKNAIKLSRIHVLSIVYLRNGDKSSFA